ncbi:MAG: hypothetical protein RLN69_06780, partial [Woeseiaceae bacterium]
MRAEQIPVVPPGTQFDLKAREVLPVRSQADSHAEVRRVQVDLPDQPAEFRVLHFFLTYPKLTPGVIPMPAGNNNKMRSSVIDSGYNAGVQPLHGVSGLIDPILSQAELNQIGGIVGRKLYVGNLPYSATDESLGEKFGAYGSVDSAKVITDRDTGRSKGFGFVEMSTDAEANAAIEGLNGKDFEGR